MKIALVHFRAGQTDGVSLEMEKWKKVLERMGHDVFYIAGQLTQVDGVEIPSISMDSQTNFWIHRNAFEEPSVDEEAFVKAFDEYVFRIERELQAKVPPVDLFIVNNILSLGFNLPAAVAITEFAKRKKIKIIGHHHDFYWERERYSRPQNNFVIRILDDYFPPKDGNILHVTINSLAQRELLKKKGIDSRVIPNVFDFDQPNWQIDDYNNDLRLSLGIGEGDVLILQATRIVQRKAIEIAMDFVEHFSHMTNKVVHFVIAGFFERESQQYYQKLMKKAQQMSYKTHFAFEKVRSTRFVDDKKYYSLWDMYAISDAVTYTSILEGWGNQLIEAIFAKRPLIVYEYPVYKSDIAPLGFDFISVGDKACYDEVEGFYKVETNLLHKAAMRLNEILSCPEELSKIVEKNFKIGKKYLSLQSLQEHLQEILAQL